MTDLVSTVTPTTTTVEPFDTLIASFVAEAIVCTCLLCCCVVFIKFMRDQESGNPTSLIIPTHVSHHPLHSDSSDGDESRQPLYSSISLTDAGYSHGYPKSKTREVILHGYQLSDAIGKFEFELKNTTGNAIEFITANNLHAGVGKNCKIKEALIEILMSNPKYADKWSSKADGRIRVETY